MFPGGTLSRCGGWRLAFGNQVLYWLPENGVSGTGLKWKRIEKTVGQTTVHRTLERLAAKFF